MFTIAFNFNSLLEYVEYITLLGSKGLCPARCKYCGKAGMHSHGHYLRKADRENHGDDSLNPVPIFRFYCPCCKHTCSVLPLCIAPRRWYLWTIQQAAFVLSLLSTSIRSVAVQVPPARSTISRWVRRFKEMFLIHSLHLRSRFPELGRHDSFIAFWQVTLKQMSLAQAIYWIHHVGGDIP